jgi:ribosomal protein L37AE/L43A
MKLKVQWESRVEMKKILQLYEQISEGIYDEDLVNEIAYAFYARCESIIEVTRAEHGEVTCKECQNIIVRKSGKKDELLICKKCGWKIIWEEYFETYHRKQLSGGSALPMFKEYISKLPNCSSLNEKVLLVDWMIHKCHISIRPEKNIYSARPAAINLINGRMNQIVPFLNTLPLCPDPKMRMEYHQWKLLMIKSMNLAE